MPRLLRSRIKMNLLLLKLWRRKNKFVLVLLLHLKLQRLRPECLVKVEKVLNLWVEDMKRKPVSMDGNMLCLKALSLYKGFSKGFPEMSDTQPFNVRKGWSPRLGNRFGLRNVKTEKREREGEGERETTFT
uniref:HTH CENPB-type domain-containing protein n=1 Tax=Molossus molossus TaxID=27622 RepID=A0A7J8EEE7_MOLMO|nr:hypothetical protein HJG59_008896 [Molossus molossus]